MNTRDRQTSAIDKQATQKLTRYCEELSAMLDELPFNSEIRIFPKSRNAAGFALYPMKTEI